MFRDAASDCRAEALAEKDDAIGRDTCGLDDKVDDSGGILDESVLGGRAGGVTVAAVVDGEDVIRRCVSQGVVAVWATTLGDVAGVLHNVSAMVSGREENDEHHALWFVSDCPVKREWGLLREITTRALGSSLRSLRDSEEAKSCDTPRGWPARRSSC
jgi:hypothetical protein